MKETLEGVEEIFDKRGATDATQTFERLWSITEELMVKIRARFELTRDPSTKSTYPTSVSPGALCPTFGSISTTTLVPTSCSIPRRSTSTTRR